MPPGNVYARHQEKARKAGYERWQLNTRGKYPIALGASLTAEWNNKTTKSEFTAKISKKIETFAQTIAKAVNIAQNAVNFAQSAAKNTAIPIGFEVKYPNLVFVGAWYLDKDNNDLKVYTKGEINLAANPLIGISGNIDILGAAIAAASYGTTGNPAAAKLINQFRGGLEKLGASVTFTAEFYGELYVEFDALEIAKGKISGKGKTTIGGKMGVKVLFTMEVVGKLNITDKATILPKFRADASLIGDAYFGGEFVIDSDEKGLFTQPVLKFSGIKIEGRIEGELGWWKNSFGVEEKVIDSEVFKLDKKYIN